MLVTYNHKLARTKKFVGILFYYWSANPFRLLLPKSQDCFWMYASNTLERPSCLCFPEVRVEIINFRFITIHPPPTDRTQTVVSDEHTLRTHGPWKSQAVIE